SYQCGGAGGCTGHSEGNAKVGAASGNANSDCTAAKNGQCAGTTLVGASSDGSAMAGASCQGTEGSKCHYHFEGTASDSSRSGASWAKAYAHGSRDGEMGGGVVQVMAKTQASAHDAEAQASCTGAKNCTSPYSAHAEAHDRSTQTANAKQPDMPSGVWKANGSGTCSGNGKGGCGVHAWAQAGPGGSGGAACTGDCSHFKEEQSGNGFTQTGPSWNQILAAQAAARAAQAARQVQDIDQWAKNAKPGDSVLGYKKNPDGTYKIYTKAPGGQVTTRDCAASECAPGKTVDGPGGKITFPTQGNPETTQSSAPGKDPNKCDANVGCALSGDGTGNDGRYWIKGNGKVHDGLTGSTMTYPDSRPGGSAQGPNINEGSFGSPKGAPFTFTCNGGCKGDVSNVDLGKGKFTDHIDLAGTPNLLVGRNGLGNLGDYSHTGAGTITLQGRDGKPMKPITSTAKDGLSAGDWAQITNKYGYTPWDIDTLKKVLGPGDSLTGFQKNPNGSYTVYSKDPNGQVQQRECQAGMCDPKGGGGGQVTIPKQGDSRVTQPSAPGHDPSTCTANDSCGLASDSSGDGFWWLTGNGKVHDGVTGSQLTYPDSRSKDDRNPSHNSGNLGGTGGTPFAFTCTGGCQGDVSNIDLGKGKFTDQVDLAGSSNLMTGRDGQADPGTYSHAGKGVVTLQVGKDGKDVITSDGNGNDPANNWTIITTRGVDSPGYYDMGGGQTGEITLNEGYGIKQVDASHKIATYNDKPIEQVYAEPCGGDCVVSGSVTYPPGTVKDGEKVVGQNNGLSVTTPDGKGDGGSLGCDGDCALTRPKDMEQAPALKDVSLFEPMIKKGELPSQAAEIKFNGPQDPYHQPDSNVQKWVDPYGNKSQCDSAKGSCNIGMVYGKGGGVVCSGAGCDSTNVNGEHLAGAGYLLFPTTDRNGKITGNDGFGCQGAAKGVCQSSPGLPNLGWAGTPDASWMAGIDPTYLRPGQNTEVDQQLYKLFAPYGIKPGDPLPPLDASGLALLKQQDEKNHTNYYQEYVDSLPALSQGQLDLATLKVGSALSTLQTHSQQLEKQVKGLQQALDAQAQYNQGKLSYAALQPHLKVIKQALAMDQEYSNARNLVDGITGLSYEEQTTAADEKVGENPALVGQTPGETLQQARKRFADNGLAAYGIDPKTGKAPVLNDLQKAQASAATVAGLNASARTVVLDQQRDAYNQQNDALKTAGGGTPDQVAHLQKWYDQITTDSNAIQIVQGSGAVPAPPGYQSIKSLEDGLPGKITMSRDEQRSDDILAAKAAGDTTLANRLGEWNKLQIQAEGLVGQMNNSHSTYQKQLVKDYYQPFSDLAGLNYNTLARDQGSRDPSKGLDGMPLPSSGHPDLFFAVRSAYYTPEQNANAKDDSVLAKAFDQGGLLKLPGVTAADRRAQLAAQGISSRDALLNQFYDSANIDPKNLTPDQIKALGGPADKLAQWEKDGTQHSNVSLHGTLVVGEDGQVGVEWTYTVSRTVVNRPSYGGRAGAALPSQPKTTQETKVFDRTGEHYDDLQDFLDNNHLFNDKTQISTSKDWTGSDGHGAGNYTGIGHSHPSWWDKYGGYVVGGAMVVGGILTSPIGGEVATGVGIGMMAGAASVSLVQEGMNLENMSAHGLSINPFTSADARNAWLAIGGDVVSLATLGVAGSVAKIGGAAIKAADAGDGVLAASNAANALKTGSSSVLKWTNRAVAA
ncbi:MAG: mucin9, partial [Pseudonocardiales bacterium]|nr:mucin9 [Pseudonocardiales bacterium]